MHLPSFEECNITYKFFHMQLFARVRSLLYMDRYRQQFEFAKPFSFLWDDYPFKAYSMYICKYIYIYTLSFAVHEIGHKMRINQVPKSELTQMNHLGSNTSFFASCWHPGNSP